MTEIDYTDPYRQTEPDIDFDAPWFTQQHPSLQAWRRAMYQRHVDLARALLSRLDAGEITTMMFDRMLGQLTYADVKTLARMELEIKGPPERQWDV